MQNLIFKTGSGAYEYITEYFGTVKRIEKGNAYYGLVLGVAESEMGVMVEVTANVEKRRLFKKANVEVSALLMADADLAMQVELKEGDLVFWGCEEVEGDGIVGVLIEKCKLELDLDTGQFIGVDPETDLNLKEKQKLPFTCNRGGRLYSVERTGEGELRFLYDNGKDLRQWRVEPQSTNAQILINAIEAHVKNSEILRLINNDLSDVGVTLVEVNWY